MNPLVPLQHHVSQNAILMPQPLSQNYVLGQMMSQSQEGQSSQQAVSYKQLGRQGHQQQ